MIPVLASMIAAACFLLAAFKHKVRGEIADARKCFAMVIFSLALLGTSLAYVDWSVK